MIEVELLNIMKKIIESGGDLKPFCERIIYLIQGQHVALAGVRVGIETRESIERAVSDLVETLKKDYLPKLKESELEITFPDKAP